MTSHLVYNDRSLWPRMDFHSGFYFKNPCYAATSPVPPCYVHYFTTNQTNVTYVLRTGGSAHYKANIGHACFIRTSGVLCKHTNGERASLYLYNYIFFEAMEL